MWGGEREVQRETKAAAMKHAGELVWLSRAHRCCGAAGCTETSQSVRCVRLWQRTWEMPKTCWGCVTHLSPEAKAAVRASVEWDRFFVGFLQISPSFSFFLSVGTCFFKVLQIKLAAVLCLWAWAFAGFIGWWFFWQCYHRFVFSVCIFTNTDVKLYTRIHRLSYGHLDLQPRSQ